jgi:hypothetical protein
MSTYLHAMVLQATQGRGFSPAEIAQQATDKIIYVGDKSHPLIRDQALEFKKHINAVLHDALKQAVEADRITQGHRLQAAGHAALVPLLFE